MKQHKYQAQNTLTGKFAQLAHSLRLFCFVIKSKVLSDSNSNSSAYGNDSGSGGGNSTHLSQHSFVWMVLICMFCIWHHLPSLKLKFCCEKYEVHAECLRFRFRHLLCICALHIGYKPFHSRCRQQPKSWKGISLKHTAMWKKRTFKQIHTRNTHYYIYSWMRAKQK